VCRVTTDLALGCGLGRTGGGDVWCPLLPEVDELWSGDGGVGVVGEFQDQGGDVHCLAVEVQSLELEEPLVVDSCRS
jgi:hypothetical protein